MIVQTRNLFERFAAGGDERVTPFLADFFQGFQAVRDERRAHDQDALLALFRQAHEFDVGERRQPGFAGETGLKRDRIAGVRKTRANGQRPRGGEHLGAVAGGVNGRARRATVGDFGAVSLGGIRFAQVPLGNAVIAEEQMIVWLLQIRRRDRVQCFDIICVGKKWLDGADAQ